MRSLPAQPRASRAPAAVAPVPPPEPGRRRRPPGSYLRRRRTARPLRALELPPRTRLGPRPHALPWPLVLTASPSRPAAALCLPSSQLGGAEPSQKNSTKGGENVACLQTTFPLHPAVVQTRQKTQHAAFLEAGERKPATPSSNFITELHPADLPVSHITPLCHKQFSTPRYIQNT